MQKPMVSLHISSSSQLLAVQFFTLQLYMVLRNGIFFLSIFFIIIIIIRTSSFIALFPPSLATVAKSDSLLRNSKPSVNGFEVLNYS